MADRDFYKILGVDSKASAEEIKKAFRRRARQYHPDKTKGDKVAEERFKAISEAYEVLGDVKKRREYDALRSAGPFGGGSFTGGHSFAGGDLRNFTGASGFSGIFDSLFSGGAETMRGPRPGKDLRTDLTIPFDLAVRGGKQKITITTSETDPLGAAPRRRSKELTVTIPPGIGDGQTIRLAGAGEPGVNSGPSGSMLITIHVRPHPEFTRKQSDIYSTFRLDLKTAMLGGTAPVKTLDRTVTVKIPPGTQSGQQFKIQGQGGPTRDGARGDHYATAQIVLPDKLTDEQRRRFEAFIESLEQK
jgi:DnaJ-class molecular chaperone